MIIKRYDHTRQREVDALIRSAFQESNHGYSGEAELTQALREGETPTFELIALENDAVVGHALLSVANISDVKGLVLAPLSVIPSHQKQGVGAALMAAIETVAREQNAVFISILGDPQYYSRFGYSPAQTFDVLAPMDVPNEYFMLKVFDDMRPLSGTLTYAPEFGI